MSKIKTLSEKEIDCVCGAVSEKDKAQIGNNAEAREFFLKSFLVMLGVPTFLFFSYKFISWIAENPVKQQYPRSRVTLTALLEKRLQEEENKKSA